MRKETKQTAGLGHLAKNVSKVERQIDRTKLSGSVTSADKRLNQKPVMLKHINRSKPQLFCTAKPAEMTI